MFSASIVDLRQFEVVDARSLVPVVVAIPEPGGGHRKPSKPQPGTVLEAKTRVWEEFGEAMEEDYRSASKRFWQTVRRLRRGKQYSANTVYSAGGELLTSTEDIVGRWKKYFEDLLNPTDLPSNEEAEDGDSEVDSSITQAEVTEVVQDHTSQPPREGLRQGTGEENSADSRPSDSGGTMRFFVLVVEQWTSSIPSAGCLRVYGSLPNQSTCALWIWRRHSTVSLVVFCGECSAKYGVRGPLLRAVRSLYDRSRSLVRIAGSKSDLFPVHVGLRQGCPLSPVLFIIFMDRISRRSQGPEGVRFGNHRISSLLFADDVVLLASSSQDLQHVLERFAAECEAAGMRISTSKSEAMVTRPEKGGVPSPASAELCGSVYRTVVVKKELSRKAKLSIYRSIYVPTLTYGHELWVMTRKDKIADTSGEMSFLRRVAGRSLRDRVRSSVIREELGVEPLLLRIERSQLRWLGHLFRMPPGRLPREVFQACPTGRRPRGKTQDTLERLCLGWPGNASGSPGRAGGSVWGEGGLGISAQTAASATRSRTKRMKMDGWMDEI
ncbi:hypothetical protein L3Q82_014600 [Scortum barcoo]|uniref:Uncharacterized protein n=2 Tax=Scortum barcoo TaxID=214431 RepID=A0ACB8VXH3_9TELE|nr:hypothetical protein L3Q82_014600 [Scortum barcoo]